MALTPVIVGVADVINRARDVASAKEPLQLILESTLAALSDTQLSPSAVQKLHSEIDSIDVVACWSWLYEDLPGLLAKRLDVEPKWKRYSGHAGNQPAKLLDEAARRISKGEVKVAVVAGGEALASVAACVSAKKMPPPGWTTSPVEYSSPLSMAHASKNTGTAHSIGLPIHVYPLYENAFRAHRHQTIEENNSESGKLYSEFAKVAAKNPLAWNNEQKEVDEDSIKTVSKKNRLICFPYPLLMNAFNNVNMAASCILTSTEHARELGIPESNWIYPLGGAGTADAPNFWDRPNFYTSPAISNSLDAGLKAAGLTKNDIDVYDFYSCFPIVPKLALDHLGLPITNRDKKITLLGGLTSFGGAGNNYSMHAITAMTRLLRSSTSAGTPQKGLVLANGGVVSYQHVLCLSRTPRAGNSPYPSENPLPEYVSTAHVDVDEIVEGECIIETYTVEYDRNNAPTKAFVIGRLKNNNHRFIANDGNAKALQVLGKGDREVIGQSGWVQHSGGRNLFRFEEAVKL